MERVNRLERTPEPNDITKSMMVKCSTELIEKPLRRSQRTHKPTWKKRIAENCENIQSAKKRLATQEDPEESLPLNKRHKAHQGLKTQNNNHNNPAASLDFSKEIHVDQSNLKQCTVINMDLDDNVIVAPSSGIVDTDEENRDGPFQGPDYAAGIYHYLLVQEVSSIYNN